MPPAQDGVLPHPVPDFPDRVAPTIVPPAPPNPVDDPMLSTNHEYNWYVYKNPDYLP